VASKVSFEGDAIADATRRFVLHRVGSIKLNFSASSQSRAVRSTTAGLPQFSVPGVMKDGVRGLGKGAGVAVLLERRERSDRSGSSTATRELRRGEVAK
jgi:hypothetical protein